MRLQAQLLEALPHFFYALMALALLAVLCGSPGFGLFLLVLGGIAHVARVGVEESAREGLEAEPAPDGEIRIRRARRSAEDLSRQLLP